MNKQQRKELGKKLNQLEEIQHWLEELAEEETDKADNMPENLQDSEKVDNMREQADEVESAADEIQGIIENLQEVCNA